DRPLELTRRLVDILVEQRPPKPRACMQLGGSLTQPRRDLGQPRQPSYIPVVEQLLDLREDLLRRLELVDGRPQIREPLVHPQGLSRALDQRLAATLAARVIDQ